MSEIFSELGVAYILTIEYATEEQKMTLATLDNFSPGE